MWPRTLPRSADGVEAWTTCDSRWLREHFWERSRGGPGRGQRVVQREGKADAGPESNSRGRGQLPVTPLKVMCPPPFSRPWAACSTPVSSWAASVFLSLPT